MIMNSKITQLDPNDCRPHPLLARMAMETEVIAYLRTAEGTAEELESREAARLAGVALPGVEVTEEEARRIIFSSVAHRRHLSKGAIAWLAVLMHPEAAESRRGRPGHSPCSGNSGSVGISRAALAAEAGVSLPLIDQACELYNLTKKSGRLRDRIDAAIAAGRGLGGLIAGLAGEEALPVDAEGRKRRPEPGFKGYLRTLGTFKTQLKSAAKWGGENRDAVVTATADFFRENAAAAELFREALDRAARPLPAGPGNPEIPTE